MLLTVDVGNSNICMGVHDKDSILFSVRIRTDTSKTETEYAIILKEILDAREIPLKSIDGAIISSVVPQLSNILVDAIEMVSGVKALVVGPGIKTGINIKVDDPASCGADLICTAAGAAAKYPLPAIIVDLGTATKITICDENKSFLGGMIAPGVEVSLGALTASTALLPDISIAQEIKVIGTNTVDCMASGSILGTASMVDGMIERYIEAFGPVKTIVACGGISKAIIPHCKTKIIMDKDLLLSGLVSIYNRNK